MLFNILVLFSFLLILLQLRRLVNVFPSLLACLIRWKESVNLEASVKLSHDRDMLALSMIIPFCLIAFRYRLYAPSFLDIEDSNAVLGLYFAIFTAYMLLRILTSWLFRPSRIQHKISNAAGKSSYTFFVIYTLMLLATGAVMGVINADEAFVRHAMLWVSAFIYLLFLLRKMQIFASSSSVFAAFLYLCALEMIPTGILIVSAIIF